MFHIPHYKGVGWMAIFGLGLIMLTEVTMRAVTQNPNIIAPHTWWAMSGYFPAAAYCILLHLYLKFRARRRGLKFDMDDHSLVSIPVAYWSVIYLSLGLLRVSSSK